jgi:hypothetical protein
MRLTPEQIKGVRIGCVSKITNPDFRILTDLLDTIDALTAERDAARGQTLREIAKLECPMCAQGNVPETMESVERGTYYWHHFGNLSRECSASKIQAILALSPDAIRRAEEREAQVAAEAWLSGHLEHCRLPDCPRVAELRAAIPASGQAEAKETGSR